MLVVKSDGFLWIGKVRNLLPELTRLTWRHQTLRQMLQNEKCLI